MKLYQVKITSERDAALKVIAKKDGLTVTELVQSQMDYYCGAVINGYITSNQDMTESERALLSEKMVLEKGKIIAARPA